MFKYKITLLSGMVVEYYANSMSEAVIHAERWYMTSVIKCSRVLEK
jgi:hypothetical protein